MAAALRRGNRALREVALDDDGIGPRGQRALRDASFDDASFDALVESNHVLQSYFHNPLKVFGRRHLGDVLAAHAANLRSRYAAAAGTKKLKRVLQRKYGVRLHFASFLTTGPAVMPCVLSWIAQHCDLQLMYEFKPILLNLIQHDAK